MKHIIHIYILLILLLSGCITQFIPQTKESKEFLIVEGLITDQPVGNTIKLSKSMPLGERSNANPVSRCAVSITDNLGNRIAFYETASGIYSPVSAFQGVVGRFYTLHITAPFESNVFHYESYPMELRPVPPIDSLYYEKVTIKSVENTFAPAEGCQVYLDTRDESDKCKFYRWEYDETWKIEIPYTVPNKVCYVTDNSDMINIKSTSVLTEDRIKKYPLSFISNNTDRLSKKYSMLVHQYSLSEDEYLYWEKLQNISEEVGGLYDMIPAAIPSNVFCVEDPNEKVLGYFSVSATTSKRIFIKDFFKGLVNVYAPDQWYSGHYSRRGYNTGT